MVTPAEQHEVRQSCFPAARPMANVMRIDEAMVLAPRKATAAVARCKGAAQGRLDRARLATDSDRLAVSLAHDDERGIAREASCCFGRYCRSVVERRPALPAVSAEGVGIDVHDDLITVAARTLGDRRKRRVRHGNE